jgi:nucleotide-binding universal stress UspA family protein
MLRLKAPASSPDRTLLLLCVVLQLNARAVVVSKHNRGAIKEFFMGSVSTYVVKH